jgi:thymidylate synthase (FAD)
MKLVKPSFKFLGEVPTDYANAVKHIEICGRLCYKSEDKITEYSAEKFAKNLCGKTHFAMVEHSNFVVVSDYSAHMRINELAFHAGKFLTVADIGDGKFYIGGSLTAWYQRFANLGLDKYSTFLSTDLYGFFNPFISKYGKLFDIGVTPKKCGWDVCPHAEIPMALRRYSVKFICDRGVSHELVRHRPCSFAQESTRYVNYKGTDIQFIEPWWWSSSNHAAMKIFTESCIASEKHYHALIDSGLTPQGARAALTNALKTEIITTADLKEWNHIFNMRCAPTAHPDFVRLSIPLKDEFVQDGLI